jgi:hypothetical protein
LFDATPASGGGNEQHFLASVRATDFERDPSANTDRQLKAELRRQMKVSTSGLIRPVGFRRKHQAKEEIARLPDPHHIYNEVRGARTRGAPPWSLAQQVMITRLKVVAQAPAATEPDRRKKPWRSKIRQ